MLETKISEETAKLAKEKGFNLRFADFYCDNYKGLCTEHDEFLIVEDLDGVIYDCNNEFDEGERYYVTTQSLLQKWLREYKNIHIAVIPKKKDKRFFFEGLIVGDDVNISIGSNFTDSVS